jgi:rhodanese-related sulfurtransferase
MRRNPRGTMVKTITTEELFNRLESGPLALFDVRGDSEYEKGHLPGAKTAPLGSLVFRVASIMNNDSFIVVYSGGEDCTLSYEAATRLMNLGLRNVHCYEEGIQGWQSAGLPVVESFKTKVFDQAPIVECRSVIVDRERAYGGVFKGEPVEVSGAGG